MEFYLSQYTGTGNVLTDPFRPSGSDQAGWSAIDFRPDPTKQAGRAILAMPVRADGAGRTYLGNTPDTISAALVTAIQNQFAVTLDPSENTLRIILRALLIKYAGGARWKALLPSNGQYEIWLGGGLFASQPVVSGGAAVIDNFNRADGALGSPWVALSNTTFNGPGFTVVSNKAASSGVTNNVDGSRAPLDTADHVIVADATLNDQFADVNVRVNSATTSGDNDRYIGRLNTGSGGDQVYKNLSSTGTVIGSQAHTITQGSTDTLTMSIDGSSLKFTTASGTVSITDTAVTGFTNVAIITYTATGVTTTFDNVSAYDLHQPAYARPLPQQQAAYRM